MAWRFSTSVIEKTALLLKTAKAWRHYVVLQVPQLLRPPVTQAFAAIFEILAQASTALVPLSS